MMQIIFTAGPHMHNLKPHSQPRAIILNFKVSKLVAMATRTLDQGVTVLHATKELYYPDQYAKYKVSISTKTKDIEFHFCEFGCHGNRNYN